MQEPVYEGRQLVVAVGASKYYSCTPAEARRWERQMRDTIDEHVRALLQVGPYSKHVRTILIPPGKEAIIPGITTE